MLSSNSQKDFNRPANEASRVLDTSSNAKSTPSATSARRISVSTALKTTTSSKKLPLTSSILTASKSASKVRQSMGISNRTPSNRLSVGGIVLGAHMHSSVATLAASDISALDLTTTGPSDDMENCDAAGAEVAGGIARQLFPDSNLTHTPQTPADSTNASATAKAITAADGAVSVSEASLAVHGGMASPGLPPRRKSIAPASAAHPVPGSLAKKLLTPGKLSGGAAAGTPSRRQSVAHTTMGPNILTSHQKNMSTPAGQKLASMSALSKPSATPTRRQSLAPSLPATAAATASAKKTLLSSQTSARRSLAPGALRSNASNGNLPDTQLHSGSLAQKTYTPLPMRFENSLSDSRSLDFFPEPNVTPAPSAPASPHSTASACGLVFPAPGMAVGVGVGVHSSGYGVGGVGGIGLDTSISENNVSGIFDPSLTFPPDFSDRRVSTCSALTDLSLASTGTGASAGVTPLVSPTNSATNTNSTNAAADSVVSAAAGGQSQDRIRVMVRVRPTPDSCVRVRGNVLLLLEDGKNKSREFAFDSVLGEQVSQEQVYAQAGRPAVDAVREGYPATILAYGQTASGKTHTMLGRAAEVEEGAEGLIPRCGRALMEAVAASEGSMSVTVGYLEVYNEEVFDLLSVDDGKLAVRKNTHGSGFRAEGQCHIPVDSLSALLGVVACGDQKRRVSATSQNERSSRSHAILTLTLHRRERSREGDAEEDEEFVLSNPLHLVDLAGSERYHADKGSESVHINQSLTTLATVMKNLVEGSQYINYRDSELTKLLGDSLSGNACTTLIACVHPNNRQETVSTLRFANTAKQIPVHAEKWTNGPRVSRRVLEQQLRSFQTQYTELLQAQEREAVRWTSEREDILRVQAQLLEEKARVESEKESIVREQRRAARAKEEESRLQELHVRPRLDSLIRKLHKVGLWSSSSTQGLLASPKHAQARDGVDGARPTPRLGALLASPSLASPSQRYNALLHSPLLLSPAHRGTDARSHSHGRSGNDNNNDNDNDNGKDNGDGALSDCRTALASCSPVSPMRGTSPAPTTTATATASTSLAAGAMESAQPAASPSQTLLSSPTTRRHRNKYALTIMASPSSTSTATHTSSSSSTAGAAHAHAHAPLAPLAPLAPALAAASPALAAEPTPTTPTILDSTLDSGAASTSAASATAEDALPRTPSKVAVSRAATSMTAHAPPPITISFSPVPIPMPAAASAPATPPATSRHRVLASPATHGLASARGLAQLASPSMQALRHQENLDFRTVTMYAQFLKLLKVLEHMLPHYQPPPRGAQADQTHGDAGSTSMPSSPFITSISSPKAGKKRSTHFPGHSHPFSGPFSPPTCALSRDNAPAASSPSSPSPSPSPSTPSASSATSSSSPILTLASPSPVVSRRRAHARLFASVAAHHVRITSTSRTHASPAAVRSEEEADAANAEDAAAAPAAELASLRAELAAAEAALAGARAAATAAHTEQVSAVSALSAQLAQTEARAEAAEERELAKEAALATAEAARAEAESAMWQARTEQEQLRSSTATALEELHAANADAAADMARLRASVNTEAAARAEADALLAAREDALMQEQAARTTAERQVATLTAALSAAEEARAAQEQRVEALVGEGERERAAHAAAEARVCALGEELRTARDSHAADVTQLRAECASLRVRAEAAEAEVMAARDAAEAMLTSLRAQLDAATERGVALQASLEAARAEADDADKHAAALVVAHTAALAAERAAHAAAVKAKEEEVAAATARAEAMAGELKSAHAAQLLRVGAEHAAALAAVQAEHAQALVRARAESAALACSSQEEAAAALAQVRAESANQLAVAAAALAAERARVEEAAAQHERDATLLAQFREQLCVMEARRSAEEAQVSELRGVQETLEKQLSAAAAAHALSLEAATRVAEAATAAEAALARELATVAAARAVAEQERDAAVAERDALTQTLLRAREMALGGADTPTAEGGCGGSSADADMVAPAISALRNELSAYARHAAAVQEQLRVSEDKRTRLRAQALALCRAGGARDSYSEVDVGVCYGERVIIDSDIEADIQLQSLSPACLPTHTHSINTQASNTAGPRHTQAQSSASLVAHTSTPTAVSVMSALSPHDNSQYSRSAKFAAELRSRRERARRANMLEEQGWW